MWLRMVGAVWLALASLGATAHADGMPDQQHPGYGPTASRNDGPARIRGGRRGHVRYHAGAIAREAASYGPPPPAVHAPVGPMLVAYREPYLPRGVLYNVPPPPTWASHGEWGVRALN